ncbi:transposase [Candidatus Bealeia paramacronuclearis]|uniref:transposase n=1 Tax=Candidatus Bealeia paramacronuclearis TaxID=1921001 RepID=UPI003BAF0C2C
MCFCYSLLIPKLFLKIYLFIGEGLYKHGTRVRKVWRKLSLATDEHGEIIAATLTNHTNSDCNQVDPLLRQIDAPIAEAIADSAYD